MLIVVGPARLRARVLLLDRGEPLANETARWAVVDRNPYPRTEDAPAARRAELHDRVRERRQGLHRLPGKTRTDADARRARPREGPEAVHASCRSWTRDDHDPRHVHDADRALRRTTASPTAATPRRQLHRRRAREPPLRDERGGILVLGAVMIPVFLLLTALVIDVGNWYTHKRQLQNRADAAAFAAGVEYAKNWKAASRPATPRCAQSTAHEIADTARQYAGDPEASDYAGATLPRRSGTRRSRTRRTWTSSSTRRPGLQRRHRLHATAAARRPQGNPCYLHPTATTSPPAATGRTSRSRNATSRRSSAAIGLPLPRNGARARVEIRPAIERHAVPAARDTEQRDHQGPGPLLQRVHRPLIPTAQDLAPLPDRSRRSSPLTGGGTLWGMPRGPGILTSATAQPRIALPDSRRRLRRRATTCRSASRSGIASRDEVDLNQSCAALLAAQFADCFHRLSQIRVWNDGSADSQRPRIRDVHADGRLRQPADAYFGPYSSQLVGARTCNYGVTVDVLWGTAMSPGSSANFTVSVNGVELDPPSAPADPDRHLVHERDAVTATHGANTVTIEPGRATTDTAHTSPATPARTATATPASTAAPSRRPADVRRHAATTAR